MSETFNRQRLRRWSDRHLPQFVVDRSSRRIGQLCLLAVLLFTDRLIAAQTTHPTSSSVEVDDIQLGIGSKYKLGQWTRLRASIRGSVSPACRLQVQLVDSNGVPVVYSTQISPSDGDARVVDLPIKVGRPDGEIHIAVVDAQEVVATKHLSTTQFPPVPTGQQFVLGIGAEWGVANAASSRVGVPVDRLTYYRVDRASELPTNFLEYAAVDAVVFAGGERPLWAPISSAQWSALKKYVWSGGRLIGSVARHGDELLSPGGPLSWFCPGVYAGPTSIRQTTGIEQFVGGKRVDITNGAGAAEISTAAISTPRGVVEIYEGLGENRPPTLIRSSCGLGLTVFVAHDLELPPFRDWTEKSTLATKLLAFVIGPPGDKAHQQHVDVGPVAHLGFEDLSGQLQMGLGQFHQVRYVSFGAIAALCSCYLILIGPVDYWVVRRFARPRLTWITFPLIAFVGAALAINLSSTWKGRMLRTNQATITDADLATGMVRGTSWLQVFTPQSSQLSLALTTWPSKLQSGSTSATDDSRVISWEGLPGRGFGGLERTDHAITFREPYSISLNWQHHQAFRGTVRNLPLAANSSRCLIGQWWGQLPTATQTSRLTASADSLLSGQVSNPFPVDLDDALLMFDRWAYRIGSLGQHQSVQVDEHVGIDLQTFLTERKFVRGTHVATAWQPDSIDVDRIMQLLSFYDAAKGRDYTQLLHRFHHRIDWSQHLTSSSAVLWGRSKTPTATWQVDQQTPPSAQTYNYFRLLIPVQRRGA